MTGRRARGIALILIILIAATLASPAGARTTAGDWLNLLPSADAKTARALLDHLNGQWAVIDRAKVADAAVEKAELSKTAAEADLGLATKSTDAASIALKAAEDAVSAVMKHIEELGAARAIMDAYDAAVNRYAVARELEEKMNASLDQAMSALVNAHGLAEETAYALSQLEEKFAESDAALLMLRAQVEYISAQTPAEGEEEKVAQLLDTRCADLAEAEKTYASFSQQIDALREQSDRANARVVSVAEALLKAGADETKAVEELQAAGDALAEIKREHDKLQLDRAELDAADEQLRANHLTLLSKRDAALLALENSETLAAGNSEALGKRADELAVALSEQDAAAKALANLTTRWAKYANVAGKTTDAMPTPAFDLLAAEEAVPNMIAVYLKGTRIYIFRGGKSIGELSCLGGSSLGSIDLTRDTRGKLSIRYVADNGQTRLKSLGTDAPVLFTGDYKTLTISSKLRTSTQFLGEACTVKTTMLHPNAAIVHFGQKSPLRHPPSK